MTIGNANGNGNWGQLADSQSPVKQLPIEVVDKLANELVLEYDNPTYRAWYCGVVYEFGVEQVKEWRALAANGRSRSPGHVFSSYVSQARRAKAAADLDDGLTSADKLDVVYNPTDDDLTAGGIKRLMDETVDE